MKSVKVIGKRPYLCRFCHLFLQSPFDVWMCYIFPFVFLSRSLYPPSMGIHSNFYTIDIFIPQAVNISVCIFLKLCIVLWWVCLFLMHPIGSLVHYKFHALSYMFLIMHFIFKICAFSCISPAWCPTVCVCVCVCVCVLVAQ